jgi:uncharacterized membrane protein
VSKGPALTAGVLLGIGLGGFVDGILFHQILQTHNMMSGRIPVTDLVSAKTNMVWDGFFHASVWIASIAGLAILVKTAAQPSVTLSVAGFWGSWFLGWGLFNLVEGIIDHQILGIHHVLEYADPRTQAIADGAFLGSGVLFMAVGLAMIRTGRKASTPLSN